MTVTFIRTTRQARRELADAELHFHGGPLAGLKLIGFAVWERRSGGGRNVTFPARQYSVNGERRSFALLRSITDATGQEHPRPDAGGLPRLRDGPRAERLTLTAGTGFGSFRFSFPPHAVSPDDPRRQRRHRGAHSNGPANVSQGLSEFSRSPVEPTARPVAHVAHRDTRAPSHCGGATSRSLRTLRQNTRRPWRRSNVSST